MMYRTSIYSYIKWILWYTSDALLRDTLLVNALEIFWCIGILSAYFNLGVHSSHHHLRIQIKGMLSYIAEWSTWGLWVKLTARVFLSFKLTGWSEQRPLELILTMNKIEGRLFSCISHSQPERHWYSTAKNLGFDFASHFSSKRPHFDHFIKKRIIC